MRVAFTHPNGAPYTLFSNCFPYITSCDGSDRDRRFARSPIQYKLNSNSQLQLVIDIMSALKFA